MAIEVAVVADVAVAIPPQVTTTVEAIILATLTAHHHTHDMGVLQPLRWDPTVYLHHSLLHFPHSVVQLEHLHHTIIVVTTTQVKRPGAPAVAPSWRLCTRKFLPHCKNMTKRIALQNYLPTVILSLN